MKFKLTLPNVTEEFDGILQDALQVERYYGCNWISDTIMQIKEYDKHGVLQFEAMVPRHWLKPVRFFVLGV